MASDRDSLVRNLVGNTILLAFVAMTLFVTYFLYSEVQNMFKSRLQERLVSIASTASVDFTPETLDLISGPESVASDSYIHTVTQLQRIRAVNEDVKFVYILRKTDDENTMEFVADADSLDPNAQIDLNQDGIITDEDALNTPGDPYDVSEFDELREFGFKRATVDSELAIDQWGTFLSSSSPIFSPNLASESNYLIGFDVDVSDFIRITNLALIPFVLFVVFLMVILAAQTFVLLRMWSRSVNTWKELDRQKDELISIVSHQLATPATSIKWYVEMLLDGDLGALNAEQKKQIQSMGSITADLSDLISMLLDVSRIQLGKMKIYKQSLNLSDFFGEILGVIEPKAKEKEIDFIKKMPASLPQAQLDKRYTRMTIENLLSNAMKYTPNKGRVTLDVRIEKGVMKCVVQDTGCGIPKEDHKKIFGKLYRASNVINSVDGNGLGLFVAKGAVEAQGGKIWFESEVGKGTSFYIELPLQ